ncbi:hypothetical protein Y1Q_0021512 [Alligator mississippiensis]|uniref:Uncharacterized protein n=1 Tax=Alligator mississippiensis TaxID=8496 RepID=A0A151P9V6_ALLMI|nr:hypothetical protein Y1Q_0021512 [Alligator mississippiensis]
MYGLQASAVLSAPAAACTEPASIQQGLSGKKPPTEMEFSIGKETSKEVRANKQKNKNNDAISKLRMDCQKCGASISLSEVNMGFQGPT